MYQGTFNYTIPLTGGCGAVNATGTITVTPKNNTASAASTTPTLCISTVLTDITHATTGATGIERLQDYQQELPQHLLRIPLQLVVHQLYVGTFNYTIPLTGGCGAVNATGTITVTQTTPRKYNTNIVYQYCINRYPCNNWSNGNRNGYRITSRSYRSICFEYHYN
jgi:hypothetical protein